MNKHVYILFFTFLLLFSLISTTSRETVVAASTKTDVSTPVILFLLDGLTVHGLETWMEKYQAFYQTVKRSDLGVMTMRTAGNRSVQNQLLTLSTGVKRAGLSNLLEGIQLEENGEVFIPKYKEWLASNDERVAITLGEALKRAGLRVEVIGSGDIGYQTRRLAPLLAADLEGRVPVGRVEDLLLHESLIDPFFHLSNYEQIKKKMLGSDADLLVVEIGDLRRFLASGKRIPENERALIREEVESNIIHLLFWSQQQFGNTHEFWVFSPGIDPATEKRMEWMTPVIRHVPAQNQEAILFSPTTRQPGIISNVDLFPTLLDHWGLAIPPNIEGRVLDRQVGNGLQRQLLEQTSDIFYIHKTRPDLLYQVVSLQVILLVLIGLFSMLVQRKSTWFIVIGHYLLIYVLMVPFFLLILGGFTPTWKLWQIHLYLFIGGLLTGVVLRNQRRENIYISISLLYISILLIDGLFGNMMMKRSLLGYDPVIGARFYGIGNEYMGVLVGSALLLFYLLYWRLQRWNRMARAFILIAMMLLILFYLAMPNGGTNAGGTIAWMAALLFASHQLFPELWVGRKIIYILLGCIGLFLLFLFVQFIQPGAQQTHIGRLLHQISVGGTESLFDTIKRKWEMNLRLIKASTWSKLFVTTLVVLGWFLLLPIRRRRKVSKEGIWSKAFHTIVWVSLVNLLVNDSGVVAAALSLLFATVPLLHMVLYERFTPAPAP